MSELTEEGTPFGRYRLIAPLGKGGMGQVFRAYDTETDRIVAVKVLPPQLALDDKFKERFRREAHAAARLSEPHVVPIHHFGEIDGQLYVDMRLIDGQDLAEILRHTHHFGIEQQRAVTLIGQIAEALHAAHRAGLVHRDVKPSNILVTETDFAYLIDFGIVRASEEETLTASGMTMGTVSYMAPEQFTEGFADARSDIYALTCVLFEALTGHPPFAGDLKQKSFAHVNTPAPQPSRERRGVATALDAVITRGMAKNPEQRYQTTVELADAARAALREPAPGPTEQLRPVAPLPAPPPTRPTPTRRPYDPNRTDPVGPSIQQRWPGPPPPRPVAPQYRQMPQPPWWQSKAAAIAVVIVAVVTVIFAVVVVVAASSGDATDTGGASRYSQTTLPFGTGTFTTITVDGDDTVYVGATDGVHELPPGAAEADRVRLSDDSEPSAIAVRNGRLYLLGADGTVTMIRPGRTEGDPLPFGSVPHPGGLAVSGDGTVYVSDMDNDVVLALEKDATAPTTLRVQDMVEPRALAVDVDGDVYVLARGGVVRIPDGADVASDVLEVESVTAIASDAAGNLYTTNGANGTVSRWTEATGEWDKLPFENLDSPSSVAVGSDGSIYVVDNVSDVVKLEVSAADG